MLSDVYIPIFGWFSRLSKIRWEYLFHRDVANIWKTAYFFRNNSAEWIVSGEQMEKKSETEWQNINIDRTGFQII